MKKNKLWKIQTQKNDYNYLRLGNKFNKHIVFEITPKKEFNIIVGKNEDCICRIEVNTEGKKMLKEWIHQIQL